MERSVASDSSIEEEERNWAELPRDVMSLILMKVGAIDILYGAGTVCSSWRKLSVEPQFYRNLDMRAYHGDAHCMERFARRAVKRSCGQLVEFAVQRFATDELLEYVSNRCSLLRCLRLVSCYRISDDVLISSAKKLPLLEELEISHCTFVGEVIEAFGSSCPRLKSFQLNWLGGLTQIRLDADDEAVAIAKNMPELRHLNLSENYVTDCGLNAILDGCKQLNFLDLRRCSCLDFADDLRKKCEDANVTVKLPEDA